MNIPPDVEADFGDCLFRVPEKDVPKQLLPKMEKCLRAENAYCDLDGFVRDHNKSVERMKKSDTRSKTTT